MNRCVHCGNINTVGICFGCLIQKQKDIKNKYKELLAMSQHDQSLEIAELQNEITDLERERRRLEELKGRETLDGEAEMEYIPYNKLRHSVVVMRAALQEILWECKNCFVFDENGKPSEFPDGIKDVIELILIDYAPTSGIDFAQFEASEFKLSQDALRVCETAFRNAIEVFENDISRTSETERWALGQMHKALEVAQKRLYLENGIN